MRAPARPTAGRGSMAVRCPTLRCPPMLVRWITAHRMGARPPPMRGGADGGVVDAGVIDAGVVAQQPGLLVQYRFSGGGDVVRDTSGVAPALDLRMYRTAYLERVPHGLRFSRPPGTPGNNAGRDTTTPIVVSDGPATKINQRLRASGAFSVELWLQADEAEQGGPARLVSLAESNVSVRNFSIMHGASFCSADPGGFFHIRVVRVSTGDCIPMTPPASPNVDTGRHHVVFTHDTDGQEVLYIDGAVSSTEQRTGGDESLAHWSDLPGLALGNEPYLGQPDSQPGDAQSDHRQWAGTLCYVGIHEQALSAADVAHNYRIPYDER